MTNPKFNICFTGHRNLDNYNWKTQKTINIGKSLIKLIKDLESTIDFNNLTGFIFGGALGFDTLSFYVIHKNFPQYKKILCLPYKEMYNKWNKEEQQRHLYMKGYADKIIYVDEYYKMKNIGKYSYDKLQKRNEFMVDHSDMLIAYLEYEKSGTGNCINYAKKNNIIITNLYEIINKKVLTI